MAELPNIEQLRDAHDPTLQLAPAEGDGPDFTALKKAFCDTTANSQSYADQCRINYETRFAVWNGQSEDGKKHSRGVGAPDPVPWDGASDLRVFLVDEAINAKVAMQCMAVKKANLVAVPIEGNDLKRARLVSSFMKWLVNTQIPELDREMELLAQFVEEKGLAATGQFWETCQSKTLALLRIEDLQAKSPGLDMAAAINDPTLEDIMIAGLTEHYPVSRGKAKRMLRDLRKKGETETIINGREYSRPVIRAFNFSEDLFVPAYTTDLENAPYIFRVQYYTAEQLRGFVNTDGWDADWVEAAIVKCRGKLISSLPDQTYEPVARNFIYRYQRFDDLIGVVHAYQKLSDPDDNVPGTYLTVFSPMLPPDSVQDGYAKFGLLGYAHGQYPFTLHRKEFLSRRLHDSRGTPETGKPAQDQIKAHRDARIDASSIAVLPPLMYPIGRPPSRWGPGAKVPERRQGEYHYADKPVYDVSNTQSEDKLMDSFRQYNGMRTETSDPQLINIKNQHAINKFLTTMSKALNQTWKLWQQYGNDQTTFRVMGVRKSQPEVMTKGDPNEDFDFYLSWDVQSMDAELWQQKLETIVKVANSTDREGITDWTELTTILYEAIDPTIAERIIQPKDVSTQKLVVDEKDALAKIFAGFEEDIKLGTPPQLGLQVMQQWMQQPDVLARYQGDEAFKERVDKRLKQFQFQMQQQQNAHIGKFGA